MVVAVDEDPGAPPWPLGGSRPIRYAVRSADSYGLLLAILIMLSLAGSLVSDSTVGKVVLGLMVCAVAMLALWTSRVRGVVLKMAAAGSVIVMVSVLAEALTPGDSFSHVARLTLILLVVAMPAVIFAHIMRHPVVTGETVMGALCVYLLVGLLFSIGYQLIDKIDDAAFAYE